MLKTWCTFTLITTSYKNDFGVDPIAYNEKNMLSKNFVSYVDKSLDESNTSKEDPLVSYEDKTNIIPPNS
jgi:hypothetical protein